MFRQRDSGLSREDGKSDPCRLDQSRGLDASIENRLRAHPYAKVGIHSLRTSISYSTKPGKSRIITDRQCQGQRIQKEPTPIAEGRELTSPHSPSKTEEAPTGAGMATHAISA